MPSNEKLTDRQVLALRTAVDKGGAWYARVSKMGGAWARMCDGLAERGLLEECGPYRVTGAGRAALAAHEDAKLGKTCRSHCASVEVIEARLIRTSGRERESA